MTEEKRPEILDALKRYESLRREQLGGVINLFFGLTTAAAGFCIAHIIDKDSQFQAPGSFYFVFALLAFLITIFLCILATVTRLSDFRLTARKLRRELNGASDVELEAMKVTTDRLGKWTWRFFFLLTGTFIIGMVSLAVSLTILYYGHVFP